MSRPVWTDLSRPIIPGMPVVPGDPAVQIGSALTLERDGVWVSHLALGSHTGTHVDAPAHLVPGGRTVDRLDLAELCGPALVLGLAAGPVLRPGTGSAPAPLTADRLRRMIGSAEVPPRVLVHTGSAADAACLWYPYLGADAAQLLWDRGVRLLGIDTPSPDPAPADGAGAEVGGFPVHRLFLGGDGILVENLTALGTFGPRPRPEGPTADWTARISVGVYPLPLVGRDGAPARVVGRPSG